MVVDLDAVVCVPFWVDCDEPFKTFEAFIGEIVTVEENPPLFYVITVMWLGFGVLYIVQDLAWRLFGVYIG